MFTYKGIEERSGNVGNNQDQPVSVSKKMINQFFKEEEADQDEEVKNESF